MSRTTRPNSPIVERARATLLSWPQVNEREKCGMPAFFTRRRVFALLSEKTIVLARLSPSAYTRVLNAYPARVFEHAEVNHERWLELPCRTYAQLAAAEPLLRACYERARARK